MRSVIFSRCRSVPNRCLQRAAQERQQSTSFDGSRETQTWTTSTGYRARHFTLIDRYAEEFGDADAGARGLLAILASREG
jgi:hypothetical protein